MPVQPCRSRNNLDAFTCMVDTLMCSTARLTIRQLPVKKHMVLDVVQVQEYLHRCNAKFKLSDEHMAGFSYSQVCAG